MREIVPPKGGEPTDPPVFDGIEMLVRFYANHGQLSKVEKTTGVPRERLKAWLDGSELLAKDRKALEAAAFPKEEE